MADQYVDAFASVAKQGNTLILPANLADMWSIIASAMINVKSALDGTTLVVPRQS